MEQQNTPQMMSVKDWVVTLLLTCIPLVGLILLFIWAFGNDGNQIRQNWAKGNLIVAAIVLALYLLIFVIFFGIFAAAAASGGAY